MDNAKFELDCILNSHGNQKIELREQKPFIFSFNNKRNKQLLKSSTVAGYIDYQKTFDYAEKNLVDFAVNIDISLWEEQINELKKLPPILIYRSKHDVLRYLQQEIEGITSPQMYLKVKGCYTGGHEENLRAQTININHGNF